MFKSVLIANRGEIAVRIIRTLNTMGIRSIAVYSDADTDARHVLVADEAVRLGPATAADSYLDVDRVLAAAQVTGAEALHPGYGFLSENASLALACAAAGIVWIGPPPEAIEMMGDKINAKRTAAAAGVPVVPGRDEAGLSDVDLTDAALSIGLPVLLKPSAGGGGKGMHRVDDRTQLAEAIAVARREAEAAFGDPTLLVERLVLRPRHIEIQVFADTHGQVIHLGERECSLQRRHQKIIEEAPSPLLDPGLRTAMGASAVAIARACHYVGAGTVEFIVSADSPEEYFFMEMNTRLQVEHPVTEAVTTLDLVEWQLRVAAGEPLRLTQDEVALTGHAVEARVYAEDPARDFLPATGPVLLLSEPELPHVRVDSGLRAGVAVGTHYDPMLAKVIAWAPDREQALARLDAALAQTSVLGLTTNIGFLRDLLACADVAAGRLDTELVDRIRTQSGPEVAVPDAILGAAALVDALQSEPIGPVVDPWDLPGGWRLGDDAATTSTWRASGRSVDVALRGRAEQARVRVGEGVEVTAWVEPIDIGAVDLSWDGRSRRLRWAAEGDTWWLGTQGRTWMLQREHHTRLDAGAAAADGGPVNSPMPGTVVAVKATVGDHVGAGQALVTVEAMKMEHTVRSPVAGTVTEVSVRVGQSVRLDEVLAVVAATQKG